MKNRSGVRHHTGAKRIGAMALAVLLTVSLAPAAFAASPGSPAGSGDMVRSGAGTVTGTATQYANMQQVRDTSGQSLLRLNVMARLRQAIQNRQVASDLEELRQARQQLIESGDWDAFKAALDPQLQALQTLRTETVTLWAELSALNDQIRALTTDIREALRTLPVEDQAEAFLAFHDAIADAQAAVADIRTEMAALQLDRQAAWLAYKQALLEGDAEAAATALETLQTVKQDILDLQGDLLAAKEELVDILTEYLESLSAI